MGVQGGSEELDVGAGFVDEVQEGGGGEDGRDRGAAGEDGGAEDGHAAILIELLSESQYTAAGL